jgi:hypothetical protein
VTVLVRRVATLVVLALATTACALTNTGDPSVAATVGDRSVPAEQIDENLEAIRDTEQFQQQSQGDQSGSFAIDAQTQLVTSAVRSEILRVVAEQEGIEIDEADVVRARDDLVEQLGGEDEFRSRLAEQGLSEEFVVEQLRDQQIQMALQEELGAGEDLAGFVRDGIAEVPIEVNPRYGEWNADTLSVTPLQPLAQAAPQDGASAAPNDQ